MSRFLVWCLTTLIAFAALAASMTYFIEPPGYVPEHFARWGAAVLTVVLAAVATHRLGGQLLATILFTAAATGTAVVTAYDWLLAGCSAMTAVATAVLAVVMTRPAQTVGKVIREYVVAVLVALMGSVAVAAYDVPVRQILLGNVVLLISLSIILWLAHRIGGGITGLGRRGTIVSVCAVTALAGALAYGEALRRWASPEVVDTMRSILNSTEAFLGAVPHITESFLGFPALVWGLATRAQLRQGWWICAFGSVGTAGVATSLADRDDLSQALLATGYSVAIGFVLGFVLWRVDRLLTGPRGRRARRVQRAQPLRPEPPRTHPLR